MVTLCNPLKPPCPVPPLLFSIQCISNLLIYFNLLHPLCPPHSVYPLTLPIKCTPSTPPPHLLYPFKPFIQSTTTPPHLVYSCVPPSPHLLYLLTYSHSVYNLHAPHYFIVPPHVLHSVCTLLVNPLHPPHSQPIHPPFMNHVVCLVLAASRRQAVR